MSELKPCPFCGGKVELHYAVNYKGITEYYIACRSCCYMNFESSIEKAVSKWNRRHYPPEVEKAVERMKPKKVVRRKTYGKKGTDEEHLLFTEYACPTCGIEIPILDMDTRFCADGCGQALDWSEE